MKIGVTGSSGFIGKRVLALGESCGHQMVGFSRQPREGVRRFDLKTLPDFSGLDAVIHLAGESILGFWTPQKRRRILESRVEGTRRVVEALESLGEAGPRVLISSSAIGIYGDAREKILDEASPAGSGFLADVGVAWEAEALRAGQVGVRVVCVRTGFVLGRGGAMALIAPLFKAGLGGNLGNGRQWMSCVHADDVAGIFLWAVENAAASGAFNAVLPEPCRNADFTREVARAVSRPAFLPAPAFALKLALGDLSHVMLDSLRVQPRRTLEAGYVFRFSTLPAALQDILP